MPQISVIIPTYNRAHLIKPCIDAVLAQEMVDFELIIVSDGSTDATRDIVTNYTDPRIRFFEKQNGGQASARNYGIAKSNSEFIALCDDDDQYYPNHLKVLSESLKADSNIGLVYSDALWVYDDSSRSEVKFSVDFDKKNLENYNYITPLNVLFRNEGLKKAGPFNEDLKVKGLEDWHFFLRLSDHFSFVHLKQTTAAYHVHGSNSFSPNSGYNYNQAFFHIRTERFDHLVAKHHASIFDYTDHMYPYHLVQCCLNNNEFGRGHAIGNELCDLFQLYKQSQGVQLHTELTILFALGISSFACGDPNLASNYFIEIKTHPIYSSIKNRFIEFIRNYINRLPNKNLTSLLTQSFQV